MSRVVGLTLATVLVASLLATAGIAAPSQQDGIGSDAADVGVGATTAQPAAPAPRTQMDNMSDEQAPMGGLVSSVIGMEEATVDSTVRIEQFEGRFSAANSEAERAQVVASSLDVSREQVAELEQRLETLETKRANGTISQGWFDVEVSWLLATAESQARMTRRLERAARTVSQDELARRDATVEGIEALQDRIDQLLTREQPDIHQTTFDRAFYRDLATFFERFNEATHGQDPEALADLFENDRVILSIESDAGPPAILSVRATADRQIVDIRAGGHPDATHRMEMDEQTARRLIDSENPRESFRTAVADGEITISEIES